jgi:zinc protease
MRFPLLLWQKQYLFRAIIILFILNFFAGCSWIEKIRCLTKTKGNKKQLTLVYRCLPNVEILHKPTKDPIVTLEVMFPSVSDKAQSSFIDIQPLALQSIIHGGSLGLSKKQFQAQLQAYGIQLETETYPDYSSIRMICLKKHFAYARDLLFEALVEPAFEVGNFLHIRQNLASLQKKAAEKPQEKAIFQAQQQFFKQHPYTYNPLEAYENINTITRDSALAWYKKTIQKYRLKIAIIGDLSTDSLAAYLRNIPIGGEVVPQAPTNPSLGATQSLIENNNNNEDPLSYIEGRFIAPSPNEKNSVILQLALLIASERLNKELCQRKNLTCDIGAWYNPYLASYSVVSYVTKHPEPSILAVNRILKNLLDRGFRLEEIENAKPKLLVNYYLKLQSKQGQIEELGRQLQLKNWEMMHNFPELVNSITAEDTYKVFKQYFRFGSWYMLGKADKINKDIFYKY